MVRAVQWLVAVERETCVVAIIYGRMSTVLSQSTTSKLWAAAMLHRGMLMINIYTFFRIYFITLFKVYSYNSETAGIYALVE